MYKSSYNHLSYQHLGIMDYKAEISSLSVHAVYVDHARRQLDTSRMPARA